MNTLINCSFVIVGLTSLLIEFGKGNKYTDFFTFLFLSLGLVFTLSGFDNSHDGNSLITFLILFLSVHFIFSAFVSKNWMKYLAVLSSFIIIFFFSGENYVFQDYPLVFDFKNLLIVPIVTVLFAWILDLKLKFLTRFFFELKLQKALGFFENGILIILSLYFGGTFGLLLSAVFLFSIELYLNKNKAEKSNNSIILFSIGLMLFIVDQSQITWEALLQSSSIFGLMIGTAIALLLSKIFQVSTVKKIMIFIISLLLFALILYVDLVKEHIGGIGAGIALLIGFLLRTESRNSMTNLSYLSISFGILLFSIPALTEGNQETSTKTVTSSETPSTESKEKVELKGKDILEIVGNWKIDNKNSKLNFELGPKNTRTKGYFKEIKGEVFISKNPNESTFKVQLPITGFSTFNSFRDESLMEKDYLDQANFDEISFTSDEMKLQNDYYLVPGIITLKGIKQKIELQIKYTEKNNDESGEYAIITGKSSLDRTKHNMQSDPKIGNLVDFDFSIRLLKVKK